MNQKTKKIIIIIGIIIFIGLTIFLIFKSCSKTETISQQKITIDNIPSDNIILHPYYNQNNSILFLENYKNESKNFLSKLDIENDNIQQVKELNIDGILKINYSYDGNLVFIQSEWPYQSGQIINTIYDIKNQKKYELNSDIIDIDFFENNKIIYSYQDEKLRNYVLAIADTDGKNWQEYINLGEYNINAFKLTTNKKDKIILVSRPHDFSDTKGIFYITKNKQIIHIEKEKYIYDASFSLNNEKILFESRNYQTNNMPHLYIYDINNQQTNDLNISTFLYKTTWLNDKELIIGIPVSISEDFSSYEYYATNDFLFKIDIKGKKLLQYTKDTQNIFDDISNIVIDNKNQFIYYISGDKLYKIQ